MIDLERDDATVGVVGAGAMGQGIAQVALAGGLAVVLHDARDGAAEEGLAKIFGRLERLVEKGQLEAEALAAIRARASIASNLSGLARSAAVIEAVVEDLAVKQTVFAELESVVAPDCLLASNTSSLPIASIARGCAGRERIAGMHFFNPVPLMRLVEIVRSLDTSDATVAALGALGRRMGRTPVEVKDSPGFLVNLGGRALTTEALRLLDEGVATPAEIDAILKDCGGFRMGPFELMDLTGIDVNYPVSRIVFEGFQHDPRLKTTPYHKLLLDAGRLGRKSGAGHYRYDARGRMLDAPDPDYVPAAEPATDALVPERRARLAELLAAAGVEGLSEDDGTAPIVVAPLGEDASSCAVRLGVDHRRLVALDLTGDTSRRITLMTAPGAAPAPRERLAAALLRTGRKLSAIKDSPGFVLQRVRAMIANLGCEMAQMGLASPGDIDLAMKLGLNYPLGPFEMAEHMGAKETLRIMEQLHATTGDDRYRPSLWLRRRALLGVPLNTPD
jgi:3-hydroxybutyryl-CoA dehydrogenase